MSTIPSTDDTPQQPEHRCLTSYFGERDRTARQLLADHLLEVYAHHQVRTSVLYRARSGFGAKHHLESEGLDVLSLDLPLISVAVDTAERIERVRQDVVDVQSTGLITDERVRFAHHGLHGDAFDHELDQLELSGDHGEHVKLTVYLGRKEQTIDHRRAAQAVVDELHRAGVAGATALIGVDGTRHGNRHRARFFSQNPHVPTAVIAVGDLDRITAAARNLDRLLERPLVTVERVRICKRDGRAVAGPPPQPAATGAYKLSIYTSLTQNVDGRPLHEAVIERARAAGAPGATTLEGFWGYHGDHDPHGDRFFQLHRRVPTLTTVIVTPDELPTVYDALNEPTRAAGLITCELVPTVHAPAGETLLQPDTSTTDA